MYATHTHKTTTGELVAQTTHIPCPRVIISDTNAMLVHTENTLSTRQQYDRRTFQLKLTSFTLYLADGVYSTRRVNRRRRLGVEGTNAWLADSVKFDSTDISIHKANSSDVMSALLTCYKLRPPRLTVLLCVGDLLR